MSGASARLVSRGESATEVHLRHGWSRLRPRQGHHHRLPRPPLQVPRTEGRDPEARPVHQRRPRHDEPVRARRGLRAGRRLRDRPGPRALRAVRRRGPPSRLQLHDRRRLLERHREGAPRGLPGQDRAGHPAHHRRDQGAHQGARGDRGRRPGGRGDRRHGRRHRVAAVPGGRPPAAERDRPGQLRVRPRLADAVHRAVRRAEDQADAALREGAAVARPPARRDRLPFRPSVRPEPQGEDLAALRRADQRGRSPRSTLPRSTRSRWSCTRRAWTPSSRATCASTPSRTSRNGRRSSTRSIARPSPSRSRSSAST